MDVTYYGLQFMDATYYGLHMHSMYLYQYMGVP